MGRDAACAMKISELRKLYDAEPFRPFFIHLADGRKIAVRHREFMVLAPSGRSAHVYQLNDDSEIIEVGLVTGLELKHSSSKHKRHR